MKHKRGDTFSIAGIFKILHNGQEITDFPIQVKSQIRTKIRLRYVDDLEVVVGEYTEEGFPITISSNDTSKWPIEELVMDIQFTWDNGHIVSTKTIDIECIADITR